MRLRDRFAGALVAAALLAGCGGAAPESERAPVSAPAAPAATAPNPDKPVTSPATATAPAPGAVQSPTPPTPPEKPVTTAPQAQGGGSPGSPGTAPANPGTSPPAPATPDSPVVTTPPAGQTLSFTSLQRGAYSGVTERKAVLILDDAAWRSNWQQLTARQVPAPDAPAMDFSQHSVLAVYMGEKNTGGYAIEITGVEVAGGKLKVTVRQTSPGPGAMVTQALTQPYHMVQIPKVPAGTAVEVNW